MKKLFSVLKYARNYKGYLTANVTFNILFALFNAVSLTLAMPFLKLLFEDSNLIESGLVLMKGKPQFALNADYIKDVSNYYITGLIVTQGGKMKALIIICVIIFVMTFFKNLFRYLAMFFIAPIRNGVVRDLRNKMYKKSLDLPLSYYSEEKKGDLMSRMTSDVQEIEWSIMQTLEMIFREPLTVILLFSLMILISAKLTVYILCLLPIAALFIVILGKSLKNSARKGKDTLGVLISVIEETLGSLKVIKAFNAMKPMQKKFEEINQTYYKQSVNVYRKTDLSSPLTEVIVTGILMFILFIGGSMVFNGELTGPLFLTYFILASQLIPPIKQLTTSYSNIQKGVASEERIDKILLADDVIVDKPNAKTISDFTKEIEYKNVWFAYHKGDDGYVLRDINLKIAKGKTVALVGQSGSGKTTLADMLPRFYESDKGDLLIDGTDIKELSTESVRKHIGVVTQESILFNDTVKNNIIFGMQNISDADVMEAAKIANAHDFIMQLPNGYDTIIGDRGGKLSGGQRQRLSIARAILKNPSILILDEATSALDTESEKLVQEALTNLMKNRTSVVIAHRLSTISNADEIIVMHKGEIIERGNHSQLLALDGTYKKLCDMQSFK
ncbi:MAG: ABC transporter ATP-binding protein [Bacteroidia bacterium]|nr:ABC transporter ATP-binding protein [Bacteroidia bacterium]